MFPKEGWIDTATMCTSLLSRALEAGATFVPFESVTAINGTTVTTTTLDGDHHKYDADVVVMAAGNGTRKILAAVGTDFPTLEPSGMGTENGGSQAGVGIISTTGPVASGIRHIVRATGIAMRPARNGGITFADHPTGGKWDLDDPALERAVRTPRTCTLLVSCAEKRGNRKCQHWNPCTSRRRAHHLGLGLS
ncbi:FAD-binding oxidoreductase (plasmid) [Arthrobacter sp. TES]|nr:FAD-binding oxidoreductase [Arthrobacter sp. TES]